MKKSVVEIVQGVLSVAGVILTFLGRHFGKRNSPSSSSSRSQSSNVSSPSDDNE